MAKQPSSSTNAPRSPQSFHCIHCLASASSLYRAYSPTSLKLTVCDACKCDVDPYIEREAFLVATDLVLLRIGAYRHLLLNRIIDKQTVTQLPPLPYLVTGACLLQAYLLWQSAEPERENFSVWNAEEQAVEIIYFLYLVLQALVRLCTFWVVCYALLRLGGRNQTKTTPKLLFLLGKRTLLAVLLPEGFALVTCLVQIWENTYTVRLLGSLLILTYQVLAVYTMASVQGLKVMQSVLVIGAAVVTRTLVGWGLAQLCGQGVPCAGLSQSLGSSDEVSLCWTT